MKLKINKKFLIITTPSFDKEWKKEIKSISKKNKFLFISDDKEKIINYVQKVNVMIDCQDTFLKMKILITSNIWNGFMRVVLE